MNCQPFQNLISAYIDQELTPDEKRELRQHLMACADCNASYLELLTMKNWLHQISPEPLGFDSLQILKNRLRLDQQTALPTFSGYFWLRRGSLIAASLIGFFLAALILFPNRSPGSVANSNQAPVADPMTVSVTSDQNFTIDQAVRVYQAASIIP